MLHLHLLAKPAARIPTRQLQARARRLVLLARAGAVHGNSIDVSLLLLQFRTEPHLGCCLAAGTADFSCLADFFVVNRLWQ
jgi:hypothetical protein